MWVACSGVRLHGGGEVMRELNGWVWDGCEGGRSLCDECGLHGS